MPKTRGDGEEQHPVKGVMVGAQGREKQRANAGRATVGQKPSAPPKGQKEIRLERGGLAGLPKAPAARHVWTPTPPWPATPVHSHSYLDRQHHHSSLFPSFPISTAGGPWFHSHLVVV